jgi:hypothetical protein
MEPVTLTIGIASLFLLGGGKPALKKGKGPAHPEESAAVVNAQVGGYNKGADVVIEQSLDKGVGIPTPVSSVGLNALQRNVSPETAAVIEDPEAGLYVVGSEEAAKHSGLDNANAAHIEKSLDDITKVKL